MLTQTKLCAPYTNLTFFSKDGIKNPTLEEGKHFMFTKQGGNCLIINPFIEAVLRRLGLQTYCVPASIFHWGSVRFFGHVGIVVRNLTQTDQLYVLDPGNPYLTTEAVPINFERSSPSYGTPIFCYKYFMVSPGFVHMCKRVDLSDITKLTDCCHFFVEDDQYWKVLYTYNIFEPQSAPYFVKVNQTFCDDASVFPEVHNDLLLLGYPDGVMVNITRQQCLTVDKYGKTHVTKITDTSQLLTTIRRYFPQYSVERIEMAMKNLENKNWPIIILRTFLFLFWYNLYMLWVEA